MLELWNMTSHLDTDNSNVVKVLYEEFEGPVTVEEMEGELTRDIANEVADIVKNIDIGLCSEDDGDNESNSTVVIDVIDCGMECNDVLSEDNREIEEVFEEVQIEVCDSSSSGFDLGQEKSVHTLEGNIENSGAVSEEVSKERSEVETEGSSVFEAPNEGNVIETMTMSNPTETEPILDEEFSHDTLEEFIDTNRNKGTIKVHDGVPYVELEAKKTGDDAQSSDLEASGHGAVELQSKTAINREEISTAGYILSSGASLLPHPSKANAASGMAVEDDCKLKFLELKAKRNYRFIIFKIEGQNVVVEKLGSPEESYEDFTACLPADECRYAVFDFDFITVENCQKSKIFFIAWSPDTSRVRMKMVYASSKDRFKRELDGIQVELQATDPSKMSFDIIKSRAL